MNKKNQGFEKEVEEILSQMTLEEKTKILHGAGFFCSGGVERLSIPPVKFSDGPMGVRMEFHNAEWIRTGNSDDFVTYLPSNSALASTWNEELAYETGKILGEEARGRGKDMILAPGINIKRSPLCGRNFEYMSEDPKLIEKLTVPLIEGIQESDVSACVKHFAANAQETDRLMVDTIIDERTMREIYLPGFRAAVERAGTYSIMCAYNKLNGWHCSESKVLLDDILREEWGFDGTVVSDWGAVHRTKESAEVSMDIEMSVTDNFDEYKFANPLIQAVKEGDIPEETVNEKVRNILRMMLRLKMIGTEKEDRKPGTYNTPEHRKGVYDVAAESIVLLKNEDKILPLSAKGLKKVAVIGSNAEMLHANGGGSAEIKALYEISPLMGLKMRLGGNADVKYAPGYFVPVKEEGEENWQADSTNLDILAEQRELLLEKKKAKDLLIQEEGKKLYEEAIALAKECDSVIFVGGLNHDFDVEGQDRSDMVLPYGQDALIEELLTICPEMVIVMMAGAPVEMPWADKAKSIVWSYYAGTETGTAIADVLLGKVNPSGKLAETFPVKYEDTPSGENGQFGLVGRVEFLEGIFVGYRYFESKEKKPLFSFGHGLSYTEFAYSGVKVDVHEEDELEIHVELTVENIGEKEGAEVVQLYIGEKSPVVARPVKELKAFKKVFLKSGEKKKVEITLTKEDFGYFDVEKDNFHVNAGSYSIYVGTSSENIREKSEIILERDYDYR